MSSPAPQETQAAPARSIMPPCRVLHDFLDAATIDGLLAHAVAIRDVFEPTLVRDGVVDPTARVSVATGDLGDFRPMLAGKIRNLVPDLVSEMSLTPFKVHAIELELVKHGDGAFYTRHTDTKTRQVTDRLRVLSGVYYFHVLPKAFSGGELRLFAIGDDSRFVDIAPERNSLLVFPSWAPHEVRPVRCPSGRFIDSRFAINCWVHKLRDA